MQLADFDYQLPEELIAQEPLSQRSTSRMLVLDRAWPGLTHSRFADLAGYLRPGDLLIRNETRVIPARLIGRKVTGGQVEILLVRSVDAQRNLWKCMAKSSKPLRVGVKIELPGGMSGVVESELAEGQRLVRFVGQGEFLQYLEDYGHIPLPPYIRRNDQSLDHDRYQTVFAKDPGAVAAPTAGLHFTSEIFAELAERGIETCGITLHVGPGTFLPVRTEDLREHRMHAEAFVIPVETAVKINRAREEGRRVIAIGTTVTRALEHAADVSGRIQATCGQTALFIRPGYRFKVVDALVTNFHLPKSTLLVLVSAFAGRELILEAYRAAIAERYRFFSYGDCMLIL